MNQVLLFEGSITLLIPLQEAVHGIESRKQFAAVYEKVVLIVIGFYALFGMLCWVGFGSDVPIVLTTTLPAGLLATSVQLAYSLAVVFTFPLQNFPALEITTRTIKSAVDPRRRTLVRRNVISSVVVLFLAGLAACTMDSLDKVVSLMGSCLGCPIAFVFPPLIHSYLVPGISVWRLWGNRIVAALGMLAMICASVITLREW